MAKFLNKIVNLEAIDQALTRIEKNKRQLKERQKFEETDLLDKEKELSEYNYIDDVENIIRQLECEQQKLSLLKDDYMNLYSCIKQIESVQEKISAIKKLPSTIEIDDILEKLEELEIIKKNKSGLESTFWNIISLKSKIKEKESELPDPSTIDIILSKIYDLDAIQSTADRLQKKYALTYGIKTRHESNTKEQDKLMAEYKKLMPNICPLCEQEIKI